MQTVSWAGSTYNIPNQRGDTPWSGLSDFAIAVASKGINTGGGNFTLLADVNLGGTFGLISTYYKSRSANIASAGVLRLANTDTIKWRNAANGADNTLAMSADALQYNGATLIPAGAGSIVNADISASAAIAFSKMAALTVSRALQSSAGGVVEVSAVTSTELGYVSGVTSAVQTQLDAKATTAVGVANSLAYYTSASALAAVTAITASRALASDSNGLPVASATTATELGYVSGVTSAIQTQFTGKRANFANGQLPGTATNDSPTAGNVGEVIEGLQTTQQNLPATDQYGDLTSIALTAGDWMITCMARFNTATSSGVTAWALGFSSTSGNSATGLTNGDNYMAINFAAPGTNSQLAVNIVPKRVSLAGSTTYYLKYLSSYSGGQPVAFGRLTAVRIR